MAAACGQLPGQDGVETCRGLGGGTGATTAAFWGVRWVAVLAPDYARSCACPRFGALLSPGPLLPLVRGRVGEASHPGPEAEWPVDTTVRRYIVVGDPGLRNMRADMEWL